MKTMLGNLKCSTGKHEKVAQKPLQKKCKIPYKNDLIFQPTETPVGFFIFGILANFFETQLNAVMTFIKRNMEISNAVKCEIANGRNAR